MTTLDIILAICLLPAVIQGVSKGFISQAIALISLIVGVWASFQFAEVVCNFLMPYLSISEQITHVIAFILIFCGVAFALHIVEAIILKVVKITMLGWVDKLLGIAFALFKTFIILGVVVMLFNTINVDGRLVSQETLDSSVLYGPIKDFAYTVFPYFKQLLLQK